MGKLLGKKTSTKKPTKRRGKYCQLSDIPVKKTKEIGRVGVCYRVQDVAEVFGMAKQTVYAMINKQELVGYKIGKATWVPLSSIESKFCSVTAGGE